MRIALVVHDFDPAYGQGRYAVELARRLAPQHDVHIYANTFGVPLEPNLTFIKVPACRRTALTTILSFVRAAERRLGRHAYEIVHAQGLTCWHADVVTAHICCAARLDRTPPSGAQRRWSAKFVAFTERRFYAQARIRHLIAVSGVIKDEIAAYYGWTRPTTVIHHGTDAAEFRPPISAVERQTARALFQVPEDACVWLFIGEATKGLRQALEQLAAFPQAWLLVVSRSDLTPYRTLTHSLGVARQVIFWGPQTPAIAAYQAADVLVYASEYDSFGLVVAEAMACGLPVIVGNQIGAAEWIEAGINGLTCDPANPASLKDQLHWLLADPARARRMGAAARATVERHTWDQCAASTLAVYQSALGAPAP